MSSNGHLSDHLPPQNLEAERSVIGGMLIDNESIHDVLEIVEADDFYREAHRVIFKAVYDLYGWGTSIDPVTLADELTRRDQYRQIGGDEMLLEISQSTPHAANVRYHAEIVKQKAIARQLIQSATEIIADGYSNLFTANELLESAERKIFGIGEEQATGKTMDGQELANEFMAAQARRENGEIEGMTTGLSGLDDALCGMRAGQLIILAARPGQGKTSLALNIAQHVTMAKNRAVLFVSLEMTRQELTERWVSSSAMVDSRRLRNPKSLELSERMAVAKAVEQCSNAPILIDDRPGQTLVKIASNARRQISRVGMSLLIVDYLGYVNGQAERGESVYAVVSRVSRGLKALAKELRIPCLVLHQLNRKSEDRSDQRPRMADLRDSGQIEADADVVLLLHSLAVEGQATGAVECIIPKNRNGAPGVVNLSFHGPCTRFDMLARGTNGSPY